MAVENAAAAARQIADDFAELAVELDNAGLATEADRAHEIADAADDLAIVIGRLAPALTTVG